MSLPEDLQRVFNVGAKVYDTKSKRLGKVTEIGDMQLTVEYINSRPTVFIIQDFKQMLLADEIVSQSRLTMGAGNNFKVRPRMGNPVQPAKAVNKPTQVESIKPTAALEFGFVNFKNGKFSKTNKRGYAKIEYRKVKETVTLELTTEDIARLKEMGIL